MKKFYIQLSTNNKITDVIDFPHEGYVEANLSTPLPPSIMSGCYELLNGEAVYRREWDTTAIDTEKKIEDLESAVAELSILVALTSMQPNSH